MSDFASALGSIETPLTVRAVVMCGDMHVETELVNDNWRFQLLEANRLAVRTIAAMRAYRRCLKANPGSNAALEEYYAEHVAKRYDISTEDLWNGLVEQALFENERRQNNGVA